MSNDDFPNMTGLDEKQLKTLKAFFGGVQTILKSLEQGMASDKLPSVPPNMILLTALRAVLTGATHWDVPAKDLLGTLLAAMCHTEEEAHVAVAAAFASRRQAEGATGVSHGPPAEPVESPHGGPGHDARTCGICALIGK